MNHTVRYRPCVSQTFKQPLYVFLTWETSQKNFSQWAQVEKYIDKRKMWQNAVRLDKQIMTCMTHVSTEKYHWWKRLWPQMITPIKQKSPLRFQHFIHCLRLNRRSLHHSVVKWKVCSQGTVAQSSLTTPTVVFNRNRSPPCLFQEQCVRVKSSE